MSSAKVFLAVIFAIAAVFGLFRYQQETIVYQENELAAFTGTKEKVRFQALVTKDPQEDNIGKRIVVEPEFVSRGKILLFVEKSLQAGYADRVEIVGVLEEPGMFDNFNYADFLAKDGIYAVMYQPSIQVKEEAAYANILQRTLGGVLFVKGKFREVLHKHLSPPESTILAALLLGDKSLLSDETAEKLNRAGVRHITAISGMHVAVLTIYLVPMFLLLGLWRQQAFYITMAIIIFFVLLTGLQASAVRAGIMGGMLLLGQYLGRVSISWRALLFAATSMLIINPLLLTKDVGFQLSFFAVLGIIVFLPIFQQLTQKIAEGFRNVRDLLGMTLAAQIFTLPILIFNFGQVSVVSFITNILVVPILPFLMGFGFVFLFAGILADSLGFIFSLPISLLLQYVLFVVDFFARLPFAAVQTENLSIFWLALFYLAVAMFYWKFRKRREFLV